MPKPLSPEDVARALNGLASPYAARRKDDAKALAYVSESNWEIVSALIKLSETDPDAKVREGAKASLSAAVHQPLLQQIQAQHAALASKANAVPAPKNNLNTQNQSYLVRDEVEPSPVLTPATPMQWLAWTRLPATRSASPEEIRELLKDIRDGSSFDREGALARCRKLKPREAVPELLRMAGGGLFSDPDRRFAAIMALGTIGDAAAVATLLQLKMTTVPLDRAICGALTQIGDNAAIPYWEKMLRMTPDLMLQTFSAIGLGYSGRPDMIAVLVKHLPCAGGPVADFGKRIGGNSDSSIGIANAALGAVMARKTVFKNSFALVDWHLDLNTAQGAPVDVGKMWLWHLWASILNNLAVRFGSEALLACRSSGQSSAQRLVIELAALGVTGTPESVVEALQASLQAKDYCERILAYEGWILLAQMGHPLARQRIQQGLSDPDTRIRASVGAAILFRSVEELLPDALKLINDASADVRASLVVPLGKAMAAGHVEAFDAIMYLAEQDKSTDVQKEAQALLVALTPSLVKGHVPSEFWTVTTSLLPKAATVNSKPQEPSAAISMATSQATVPQPAPSPATIFCQKCGAANTVGYKFCLKCGTALKR